MSLTASLTDTSESYRKALQDQMESDAGVKRLAHMAAVESIRRNLGAEDRMAWEHADRMEQGLFSDSSSSEQNQDGEGEEMPEDEENLSIMAARDVHVYEGQKPSHAPQPPLQPVAEQPANPPPMSTAKKVGLAAALLAAGAGGGGLVTSLLRPPSSTEPAATVVDDRPDRVGDFEIKKGPAPDWTE